MAARVASKLVNAVSKGRVTAAIGAVGQESITTLKKGSHVSAVYTPSDDLDKIAENIIKTLRIIDPDGEFGGKSLVRDPLNEPDISEMATGDETASRPINRFRNIIYDEGELNNSDFTKPPSKDNPHPFDPSTLPPTHSRTLTTYVNHLPILQKLLDLGMNLLNVEISTNLGHLLVRLDWEKDLQPKIHWLMTDVGVNFSDLGDYLTRNPWFLVQKNEDLIARLNYLKSKKFNKRAIKKIVVGHRYWLNTNVDIIDSRLGWIQRQFFLSGNDVRRLITKEPRILIFGLETYFINQSRIGLYKISNPSYSERRSKDPKQLLITYHYLTKVMKISNKQLTEYPLILRCPIWALRRRHEFLCYLKKAQYKKELPDYISLRNLIHPSDKFFAENVAQTYINDYNKFMKML